jgi:sporulation protein YlmC with PRC-barrel domain
MRRTLFAATALATTFAAAAVAQQAQNSQQQNQGTGQVDVVRADPAAYQHWTESELYAGARWSADRLLDADVYGEDGEEIGGVANLVLSPDGKVVSLIAEVGGLWDIGDTHIAVPWDQVTVTLDDDDLRVVVPVTQDNLNDYGLFATYDEGPFEEVDDDGEGMRGWRVTEILDDYVMLADGDRYGWVDDAIFDENAELVAVVVNAVGPDVYGRVGYPFYGRSYGWGPGENAYTVPYERADVQEFEAIDMERLFESAQNDD